MGETSRPSGIHQVPKMGISNAYLVEVDQGLVLVDTGTAGGAAKVLAYLETIGRKTSEISHIILTHPDADHSGSAAKLRSITGAKLAIHELDAPRLAGDAKLKEVGGPGSIMLSLFGAFMKVQRVKPDITLRDGDNIGPLTVIHTPGHTDGSICLHKPDEALFAGDLVRTDSSGHLRLAASYMSRDMNALRQSVEKVSVLEFSMLLPGHGKPILQDASRKLRQFAANGFR